MNIQENIIQGIQLAFQNIFNQDLSLDQISLSPTRKEFEGTYTFVVFPFLKVSRTTPENTANQIGEYLKENVAEVADFNVVKGFLNLVLNENSWLDVFAKIYTNPNFGQLPANGQKVMVEYSSPNTNKPLHLGHLRNNFLGYSVAEILKANGYEVTKANLVNDRGIHICKSMVAYQHFANGETPESSGLKGDHLAGKYYVLFDQEYKKQIKELMADGQSEEEAKKNAPILLEAQEMLRKWEANDEATVSLWKQMNGWVYEGFDASYKRMGVDFDKTYYESNTYLLGKDIVEEGLKKEVFFKKDNGSVWVDLTPDGLDEKLVLRGDGTSVYITQDMGTADLKYDDFKIDKSVYVVGNEQDYHFDVLFKIMQKLGRPYGPGLYHLSYGMVDLPTGKMKSREGTVVDADDLMQEMVDTAAAHTKELGKIEGFTPEQATELYEILGLGALKYFLLKVDPKKRMLFNPQESIEFQGNTGPFIQYSHARIASILRKADQLGVDYSNFDGKGIEKIEESESSLIFLLNDLEKKIKQAGDDYSPSILAQYLFDLAKEYNRFYADLPIFNENDPAILAFRVALSALTAKTIKKGMSLLGIAVPERM
ncbi:arginine--tRNA ligase [Algoriphagus zhangzhouensis]|uniref:Arginine--tRNA ligase n=1 Tax=Algoriphagus zhangzhouensis TaxID=1073327 RepID=A0A1M7Z475_9BACT|nr:arginine--tRNA ligase [Algoriphagus zhangzhouensis]TDY48658.1 arginyl-tRNA synthetase [Algoriphagus zhangzhouensis]SHO59757.1 arginyl-tRNA synthetase [Algoriphagus zhangzhouensis]